jgi:uncharacterized protein with NRDE domain
MCLLSIAFNAHPDYPLVFIGNRDEYHARESAAADWWPADKQILGGRDLQAGGTWLGMNKAGHLGVVTNRPDLPPPSQGARSRGELATRWLNNNQLLPGLEETHKAYGGFSLLLADQSQLHILSGGNGAGALHTSSIEQGITGLSNTATDQPWPKLEWLNAQLKQTLSDGDVGAEKLMALLARTDPVPGAASHGVPATPFVLGDSYGTRCCTVVLIRKDGYCHFTERRFGPGGAAAGESRFEFDSQRPGNPDSP